MKPVDASADADRAEQQLAIPPLAGRVANWYLLLPWIGCIGAAVLVTGWFFWHASPKTITTQPEPPSLPDTSANDHPHIFVAPSLVQAAPIGSTSTRTDEFAVQAREGASREPAPAASVQDPAARPGPLPLSLPVSTAESAGRFSELAAATSAPQPNAEPVPGASIQQAMQPADVLMVDQPKAGHETSPERPNHVLHASSHHEQSLTLSAGNLIGCALETAIDSTKAGLVTCVVTGDVVGDDARVTLVERGTHVLGEYRSDVRQGEGRINVLWTRLRKPDGTSIDLDAQATDAAGRTGIPGQSDAHWGERIGAALLLSVIEDGVSRATASPASGSTIVLSSTAATGTSLSQKVLDASINIAPTLSVAPGARINILVAHDLDFGSVYALQ